MTEQDQAALGRMGYSLRALVMGWRLAGEQMPLIIRALFNEAINLCLNAAEAQLPGGRAAFDQAADDAWAQIIKQNPHLRGQQGGN